MCDGPIKVGDILWLQSFNMYALQIYITNEICQIILFFILQYNNTRTLQISDLNDNAPIFEKKLYSKDVSEVSH